MPDLLVLKNENAHLVDHLAYLDQTGTHELTAELRSQA